MEVTRQERPVAGAGSTSHRSRGTAVPPAPRIRLSSAARGRRGRAWREWSSGEQHVHCLRAAGVSSGPASAGNDVVPQGSCRQFGETAEEALAADAVERSGRPERSI